MSTNDSSRLDALLTLDAFAALSNHGALEHIAELVNLSDDLRREDGVVLALERSNELESRGLSSAEQAVLDYFRANAWAARVNIRYSDDAQRWSWSQPELASEILLLRKALNSPAYSALPTLYRCQIATNLGNSLSSLGRFVEAQEYWMRALSEDQNFWMAQGNRGYDLISYAKSLYDPGHASVMLAFAHGELMSAVSVAALYPDIERADAAASFDSQRRNIESLVNVAAINADIRLDGYDLGKSDSEQQYRRWCLDHHLFLNPLNDLGAYSIAARDILTLPDFVTALDEPPVLIGFFNQIKQEFVSARWLYYDGTRVSKPHFSDKDVLLYNTLDYPSYGLPIEKIKIALRMAHSLFDKMAFFLNRYMKLGMKPKRVNFQSVWRMGKDDAVREEFESGKNWPLRGLYWLSKDILDEDFQNSTEPDAREIHDIRNHLEHKYLKVHEMIMPQSADASSALSWMRDDLAYSISRTELDAKGLRVLKLARAALIYLSLGMHQEERKRALNREGKLIAPMPLSPWEDGWKF
jgi:hypothetical protein